MTSTETRDVPTKGAFARFAPNLRDLGTLFGLVVIFVAFTALNDTFLTVPNLVNILQQSSINA